MYIQGIPVQLQDSRQPTNQEEKSYSNSFRGIQQSTGADRPSVSSSSPALHLSETTTTIPEQCSNKEKFLQQKTQIDIWANSAPQKLIRLQQYIFKKLEADCSVSENVLLDEKITQRVALLIELDHKFKKFPVNNQIVTNVAGHLRNEKFLGSNVEKVITNAESFGGNYYCYKLPSSFPQSEAEFFFRYILKG